MPTFPRSLPSTMLTVALFTAVVVAQGPSAPPVPTVHPNPYFPVGPAHWWALENAQGERLELVLSEESVGLDSRLRLDDSSGDYRVLDLLDDGSLHLVELHRLGQAPIRYEPPLPLLPASPRPASSFGGEARVLTYEIAGEQPERNGKAVLRGEILTPAAVTTAAGAFAACLPVRLEIDREWDDGKVDSERLTVWLGPDLGPVRIDYSVADGSPGASWALSEARLGDRLVPPLEEPR